VDVEGDVQRAEIKVPTTGQGPRTVVITYDEGTDAFSRVELPEPGGVSEGLRVLRSRAENGTLRLTLEGLGGRQYRVGVRTPRRVEAVPGVTVTPEARGADLLVSFEGEPERYARRTIVMPLR
jgi:hypothetical protein